MASEREFWKNFCDGIGRPELFEAHPGSQYADHARGDTVLADTLTEVFAGRSSAEWIRFGTEHDVPIAPVNTPRSIADDPQFRDRLPWIPASPLGAEQLPTPIKFLDVDVPVPERAPTVGQHADTLLREVLGYDDERIGRLRKTGALG